MFFSSLGKKVTSKINNISITDKRRNFDDHLRRRVEISSGFHSSSIFATALSRRISLISNHCHSSPYIDVLYCCESVEWTRMGEEWWDELVWRKDDLLYPIAIRRPDSNDLDDPDRISSWRYRDRRRNNVHRRIFPLPHSNATPPEQYAIHQELFPGSITKGETYLSVTTRNTDRLTKRSSTIIQTHRMLNIFTLEHFIAAINQYDKISSSPLTSPQTTFFGGGENFCRTS